MDHHDLTTRTPPRVREPRDLTMGITTRMEVKISRDKVDLIHSKVVGVQVDLTGRVGLAMVREEGVVTIINNSSREEVIIISRVDPLTMEVEEDLLRPATMVVVVVVLVTKEEAMVTKEVDMGVTREEVADMVIKVEVMVIRGVATTKEVVLVVVVVALVGEEEVDINKTMEVEMMSELQATTKEEQLNLSP